MTAVGGAVALGWRALRRRDDRAIAADPEQAELSRPPQGRPVPVKSSDGTLLHAEVFGPETAPTIVLVHGWICTMRSWHYQLKALARSHRVVAYDLRGHGRSEPDAGGDYSTGALAADLDAVLAACVPPGQKALVAGHSMGAMSMVAWAGAHPDEVQARLAGTVLIDTGIERLIAESRIVITVAALSRVKVLVGTRVLGLGWKAPRRPTPIIHRLVRYVALSRRASPAQVALCERMFLDCPADVRAAFGATLSKLDLAASLAALTVPVTVIVGELDRLTPPAHARAIAGALPDARLVVLPAVGHMTSLEAHQEVTRQIEALIRESGDPAL